MKTIFLLLLLLPVLAMASGNNRHHDQYTTNNYETNTYNTYNTYNTTEAIVGNAGLDSSGVASAMAMAQKQADYGKYNLQWSIGAARYDGNDAFALGLSKRICKTCPLLTGSISRENGKFGQAIGLNGEFDAY